MKRLLLVFLCFAAVFPSARADEGMWLPSLISSRMEDMRAKGFQLSARDVYDVNNSSMKDGIVRFGRGCTGELISAEGLLLTNHHCGNPQIQAHSSVEHDYLKNGFWAMNRSEELPNPGLVVTFLVRMEDVTERVMEGTEGLDDDKKVKIISQNVTAIKAEAVEGTHYEAVVTPLYYGNQYFLFVNEVFRDVRLVAAPPASIGNFGGDTDNWMWPRHTGDFSIFRIYADKDNKPADYSPDNVPYRPKYHFTVSTSGVGDGDFTMVYGFPAVTQQYLHSAAVDYVLNVGNPLRIDLRTRRLNIIKAEQDKDPAIRIAYAAKASGISNGWKKWQGESLGLERLNTIGKKREYERAFEAWAADKPEFRSVVSDLAGKYSAQRRYNFAMDLVNETFFAVELSQAARLISGPDDQVKPAVMEAFYKDYSENIDSRIARILLEEYYLQADPEFIPELLSRSISIYGDVDGYVDWLYANSILTNREKTLRALSDGDYQAVEADPYMELYREFQRISRDLINEPFYEYGTDIRNLYEVYLNGMMRMEPGRDFFPDANSTLRVSYGAIEGYIPQDGEICLYQSTSRGILEKDNPEIYDYDIPQALRELLISGDFGRWGEEGTLPVCFLATNHTTGGNSGSPVLNGRGELVGINFDRTWLSTMSDIEFDPAMCRNIAVDIRYVLFLMDKLGGAGYLFDEMTLR